MQAADAVASLRTAIGGSMGWDHREVEDAVGSEALLVAASRRAEPEAVDRLVESHQQQIYRFCHRWSGDHADAADLAQEVFLRAYRGIAKFRGDSALSTWLYRIAL